MSRNSLTPPPPFNSQGTNQKCLLPNVLCCVIKQPAAGERKDYIAKLFSKDKTTDETPIIPKYENELLLPNLTNKLSDAVSSKTHTPESGDCLQKVFSGMDPSSEAKWSSQMTKTLDTQVIT